MELDPNFESRFRSLASARLGSKRELSYGDIAEKLAPEQVLDLAQLAAVDECTAERNRAEGLRALGTLSSCSQISQSVEFAPVWNHIQRYLHTALPEPVLTDDPTIDLGASSGSQVILNPDKFDHVDDPWILLAHESAHSELNHSARHQALRVVGSIFARHAHEFHEALRTARRELELEADYRGFSIVGEKLAEPEKVLESLLLMQAGPDHPDGLARAENARQALDSVGRSISPEVWQELLQKTEPTRSKFAAKAKAEERLRAQMARFV